MTRVSVRFLAGSFDDDAPGRQEFIDQVDRDNVSYKLPIMQMCVPELESLVWDDARELFVGVISFDTNTYEGANIQWMDEDDDGKHWNFTPTIEIEVKNGDVDVEYVPRPSWLIIRAITDRIFYIVPQTSGGSLWKPILSRYKMVAGEASVFDGEGGGVEGGGWGGMQ